MSRDFNGKRLFLLRHGVAAPYASDGDKGRALSIGGQKDSDALGGMMSRQGFDIDLVLCSPATRTKQTLENVSKHVSAAEMRYVDILYNGSVGDYLYEIQQVDDDIQNLMIIAHNPCIYELVILLAAQGSEDVLGRLSTGYNPGTLSVVHCEAQRWTDIQPVVNELALLADPTDYNA